jgi:hypothetical protein
MKKVLLALLLILITLDANAQAVRGSGQRISLTGLLPSQTGNADEALVSNGTTASWQPVGLPPIPAYKSANWYGPNYPGNVTGVLVGTKGRGFAMPVYVARAVTITDLGIRVATAGNGSFGKMAIYDATGTAGRPGTRVGVRTAEVATDSSTTDVPFTLDSATALQPGWYWIVAMFNWVTTAPTVNTVNSITPLRGIVGGASISEATFSSNAGGFVYHDFTYASGFDSSFGAATELTGTTGGPPISAFKVQ